MEPSMELNMGPEFQSAVATKPDSGKIYLRLSQAQLQTLTTCPRKFQHLYLDQLGFPPTPEEQTRLNWGNQFHLLMQQVQMGLPLAPPLHADEQVMQRSIAALQQVAPDLFENQPGDQPDSLRLSEHRRTLQLGDYLLTVIYDLLILEDDRAQILDWKTYPRPQNARRLAQHWQTRLYLFVLAETSHYRPDQLAMTYWYVQAGNPELPQPQSLHCTYSIAQHRRTQKDLLQWLDRLTQWLTAYERGEGLPQVETAQNHCQTCSFMLRCQRESGDWEKHSLPTFAEIEEIRLQ